MNKRLLEIASIQAKVGFFIIVIIAVIGLIMGNLFLSGAAIILSIVNLICNKLLKRWAYYGHE